MPAPSSGATSSGRADATIGVPGSSDAATGTSPEDATVSQDGSGDAGSASDSGGPPGSEGGRVSCQPPAPGTEGTNPLFTDVFTADPAPFVDGCTFYIHADHDLAAAGQNAFVISDWFELASTDLVHWTRTGSSPTTGQTNTKGDSAILNVSTFAWANANAWASQMPSPMGPWKFRNGVKAATNVLDVFPTVAGQDAPTSHANGPNGGGTYRREVAIDKMSFNADGTIAHVSPSQGLTF